MEEKIITFVKSPARTHHLREGAGFSISEIKKAGKSIKLLKEMNIKIDYLRKSTYDSNVTTLKKLKPIQKKKKKKEPFKKKEKKRTPFKPKDDKTKRRPKKKIPVKKQVPKSALKKKEPVKKPISEKIPKQKVPKPEISGTPLTNLQGLGAKTSDKFNEVGVNSVEELIKENPEELSMLIKGCSLDSIVKWIEEGKELTGK